MEQIQYDLLSRWFVRLEIDDPVRVATVFSRNRDRLLTTDIAQKSWPSSSPMARLSRSCLMSISRWIKPDQGLSVGDERPGQGRSKKQQSPGTVPTIHLPFLPQPPLKPPKRSPGPPQ